MQSEEQFFQSNLATCLHKVEVRNPFTGERLFLPCGSCPACLYKKSYKNEMRVIAQRSMSRYCYFVSLTYDAKFCPYYRIFEKEQADGSLLCTCRSVPRVEYPQYDPDSFKGLDSNVDDDYFFICSKEYLQKYRDKANCAKRRRFFDKRYNNLYGRLNRNDFVLFMKRLRFNLYKKIGKYESLHTYFVSEYGPVSFRPHFHLLLFFDSEKIADNLGKCLYESWSFGSVDYSSERGGSSSYVASYLNSFIALPRHLREIRRFCPRSRFSNGFGQDFFRDSCRKVRSGIYDDFFNGKIIFADGTSYTLYPWRQVVLSCVFSAARFRGSNVGSLLQLSYSLLKIARRFRFCSKTADSVFSLCRSIVNFIKNAYFKSFRARSSIDSDSDLQTVFYFIGHSFDQVWTLDFKTVLGSLYRLYSDFNLFLKGTLKKDIFSLNISESSLISHLNNSIRFYYEQEIRFSKKNFERLGDCIPGAQEYFFQSSPERQFQFLKTDLGIRLLGYQEKVIKQKIKHRELNDVYWSS